MRPFSGAALVAALLPLTVAAAFPSADRLVTAGEVTASRSDRAAAMPAGPSAQQEEPTWPAVVAILEGPWEGRGTLFGNAAAFTMEWSRALDGRFVRLRFGNGFATADGVSPVIAAEAFYRVDADGRISGHWFDNRGLVLTLVAEASADRLVTDWTAPTESGRTTYRVIDDGAVEVIDEVRSDEGLREFARATYRRR